MPRWKKDEKAFEVKLTNDYRGSIYCRVPKPIVDLLGNPETIEFKIQREKIVVNAGEDEE